MLILRNLGPGLNYCLGFCVCIVFLNFSLFYFQIQFSGPHFRLPRFDSPLTTPSEVKINGRRILPVINYYTNTLDSLNVYTEVYTLLSKILFVCRNKIVLWFFT